MSDKKYGAYLKVSCCTQCDWYQSTNILAIPRVICPDCGCDLDQVVGRYMLEKKSTDFFSTDYVVVGFEKKVLG